jgi:hypothetical protein
VLQRGLRRGSLGKRHDQVANPLSDPAQDGVREPDRPLGARGADELDRFVDARPGRIAARTGGSIELTARPPSASTAWSSVRARWIAP